MKYRDYIKELQRTGWRHIRTVGSHKHFTRPLKGGLVTVAGHPNDDIPKGTLHAMRKQAGMTKE